MEIYFLLLLTSLKRPQKIEWKLDIGSCNITTFLDSTQDRHFSVGNAICMLFLKLTFYVNKTLKTCDKYILSYNMLMRKNFDPIWSSYCKRPPPVNNHRGLTLLTEGSPVFVSEDIRISACNSDWEYERLWDFFVTLVIFFSWARVLYYVYCDHCNQSTVYRK